MKRIKIFQKYFLISFIVIFFIFSRLTYNVTNSLTKGIYLKKLFPIYKKNNLVLFKIDKKYLKYLENFPNKNKMENIYLIKRIVGVRGDKIEIKNNEIFINGVKKGKIFKIKGLIENKNKKFILKKDEFYVMGDTQTSFDSRYFGILHKQDFLFEMKLLIEEEKLEKLMLKKILIK